MLAWWTEIRNLFGFGIIKNGKYNYWEIHDKYLVEFINCVKSNGLVTFCDNEKAEPQQFWETKILLSLQT